MSKIDLPTSTPTTNIVKFSHIHGLDGLRAISVLVVLLYHSHLDFMLGGYLGVEIFFVISGFLITSILLNEAAKSDGKIDLVRFWKRRFLRLLPALFAMLFLVTIIGAFLLKNKSSQFRFDIVTSLFYVENWYQIFSGGSYFADQGFPLLRHIWSLAVEEQFYLVWPLLVAGILKISKGNTKPLIPITLLLFLSSFCAMLVLYQPGDQSNVKLLECINRVYLGTDTRAFGILLGALLAMTDWNSSLNGWRARGLAFLAIIALGVLIYLCSVLDAQGFFLYHGGFLLVDVLTLIVITALVKIESCALKALLGNKVLEYIGQRSYGIYLWHWPTFRLIGPGQTGTSWILLRIVVTFVISEISFRYLEIPIRQGALKVWFSPSDCSWATFRKAFALGGCCLCIMLLSWSGILLAQQAPYVDEVAESLKANAKALDQVITPCILVSKTTDSAEEKTTKKYEFKNESEIDYPEIDAKNLEGISITAVGDSVMKGAAIALKENAELYLGKERIFINAEESRSFEQAYQILISYTPNGY